MKNQSKNYTRISIFVSIFLLLALVFQWGSEISADKKAKLELYTEKQSLAYLEKARAGDLIKIPTGVLLNSLAFSSPNKVDVSGYVWQKYSSKLPKGFVKGFRLPEAVGPFTQEEIFEKTLVDGTIVKAWNFSATVEQKFDYSKYPF